MEKEYPNYWEWWVDLNLEIYARWIETYIRDARARKLPILFLRFEDLIL